MKKVLLVVCLVAASSYAVVSSVISEEERYVDTDTSAKAAESHPGGGPFKENRADATGLDRSHPDVEPSNAAGEISVASLESERKIPGATHEQQQSDYEAEAVPFDPVAEMAKKRHRLGYGRPDRYSDYAYYDIETLEAIDDDSIDKYQALAKKYLEAGDLSKTIYAYTSAAYLGSTYAMSMLAASYESGLEADRYNEVDKAEVLIRYFCLLEVASFLGDPMIDAKYIQKRVAKYGSADPKVLREWKRTLLKKIAESNVRD